MRMDRLFSRADAGRVLLVVLALALAGPGVGTAVAADSGFTIFGGALAGGRLFKAVSQDAREWRTPSPEGDDLFGLEIRAEIDETAMSGLRFQKGIGDRWGVGATFSVGDADISVLQRTSPGNVDKVTWDQLLIINSEATAFYDLLAEDTTPYVLLGFGVSLWSGEGDSGLDQTSPSLVLGAGYRLRGFGFDIDIEIRDSVVFSDFGDEQARLNVADEDFDGFDPTHVWSITAGWAYVF